MQREPYVILNKEYFPKYTVYDKLNICGWEFEVWLTKARKFGLASALQGGRVIRFEMIQSGQLVCLYEDGKWKIELDDENDLAKIVRSLFLSKHNRKRPEKEEKEYGIL